MRRLQYLFSTIVLELSVMSLSLSLHAICVNLPPCLTHGPSLIVLHRTKINLEADGDHPADGDPD